MSELPASSETSFLLSDKHWLMLVVFVLGWLIGKWNNVRQFAVDIWTLVKLFLDKRRGEQKRTGSILTRRLSRDLGKTLAYQKIRVMRIEKTDDGGPSVSVAKLTRSITLVLKLSKTETNMSENLAKLASEAVTFGYLTGVDKFLLPDLKIAMTNVETEQILQRTKDYLATSLFIEAKVSNAQVEEYEQIIRRLKRDGTYDNVFVPVIMRLEGADHLDPAAIQREIVSFLNWLNDPQDRLTTCEIGEHLPRLEFVYFRRAETPLAAHRYRTWEKFGRGCEAVVLYGRRENSRDMKRVASGLRQRYPVVKCFAGHRWRLGRNEIDADMDDDATPMVGIVLCRKDAARRIKQYMPVK